MDMGMVRMEILRPRSELDQEIARNGRLYSQSGDTTMDELKLSANRTACRLKLAEA